MPQIIALLVIVGMVVFATAKVTLQGRVGRKYLRTAQDSVLFHAQAFLLTAPVTWLLFRVSFFGGVGLFLALMAALCTFLYQTIYAMALRRGPVSLTVLICNFNVLPVTAFGLIAFGDRLYLTQAIGILFLILSMLLGLSKEEKVEPKSSGGKKWFFLTVLAMLSTAMASVFMKVFVKCFSQGQSESNGFIVLMYGIAAIMAFASYLLRAYFGKKEKATYGIFDRRVWLLALGVALSLALYQRLYTLGMREIESTFLYPTYAGLQSLTMTCIGARFFKDHLTARQKWGIACGILCVVLMNVNLISLW